MVLDPGFEAGLIAVDLLRILKSRYNYRKLSTITGLPVSTLTRYFTGKTIPRGSKTKKLLESLLSSVNIPSLIAQKIRVEDGVSDLSQVMLDPNMVKILGAHVINEFAGMRITSILSIDILSIPLAAYLAMKTSRGLKIISHEPLSLNGDSTPIIFVDDEWEFARSYWLVSNEGRRRESILIVASQTPSPAFFNSLINLLAKRKYELGGFFSVLAREDHLRRMELSPGIKKSYILLT